MSRLFQILETTAFCMRRVVVVCCLLVMIGFAGTGGVAAREPVDTNAGPLFGGQWAWVNNTSSQTTSLDTLPSIAEDYTATWCTSCVKVEHVLQDMEEDGSIQKYHFHRANDHEDPFGSNETELYFDSRYEAKVPPIVVFNGTQKQVGSTPNSDSLEEDYTALISQSLNLGSGNTTFSWASQESNTGIISWSIDINLTLFADYQLSVNAWFVEASAEFTEGSNGEEIYPNIVTTIVEVGNSKTGSATLDVPNSYDGDDMQVHLMYQLTPIEVDTGDDVKETEDSNSIPSISIIASLSCVVAAAALLQRK